MSKITKRITAMLLSGMLVFGSVPGSVFAVSTDVDLGQTSEIAEEVFSEEASEAPVGAGETAELEETSEATAGAGETSAESYPEEASVGEAVQAQYYTVTLDANGGYFENEWDDAIGNCAQQAEVVEKHIPVDGVVSAFPVYINPDGQTMIFAGWGLERDGELVTAGDEEYAPVDNCVLYAVWKVEEDAPGETGDQEAADEENIEQAGAVQDSGEGEDASEKTVTAEEVTQPDLNESSEEGETVSEDAANAEVASGTCGDNLIWTLDEEETLTISGTGGYV